MIYKFIDNNDQEIAVNSLSSLQALVDSETIKKNTKIKAGLRGKWVKAESVEGLNFEEKKVEEPPKEETEDIVDIITREPEPTPPPKVTEKFKKEKIVETEKPNEEFVKEEKITETKPVEKETEDTLSEEPEKGEKSEEPEKKKEFFIKTLIMGKYSLPMTYWVFYFVIGSIIQSAGVVIGSLPNPTGATNVIGFILLLTIMAYFPISMIGVWRSADKYILEKQKAKKSVVWGGLAKFFTVLGWIQYAAFLFTVFAIIAEG